MTGMLWISTLQVSPADSRANVFCLKVFCCPTGYFLLSLRCNAFSSWLFTRATMLPALVPSAVECYLANSHALRGILHTLVADS